MGQELRNPFPYLGRRGRELTAAQEESVRASTETGSNQMRPVWPCARIEARSLPERSSKYPVFPEEIPKTPYLFANSTMRK